MTKIAPFRAVPISESVQKDGVICLYDGVKRRNMERYVRSKYGKSAEDYRAEFGLGDDYPMIVTSETCDPTPPPFGI